MLIGGGALLVGSLDDPEEHPARAAATTNIPKKLLLTVIGPAYPGPIGAHRACSAGIFGESHRM